MCRKTQQILVSSLETKTKELASSNMFFGSIKVLFSMIMELYTSNPSPSSSGPRKTKFWRLSEATRLGAEMSTRLGVGSRKIEKCRVTLPKTITKACISPELIFGMSGVPVSERNEDNVTRMFWDTLHDLTPKVNLYIPRKINKNPYLYRKINKNSYQIEWFVRKLVQEPLLSNPR